VKNKGLNALEKSLMNRSHIFLLAGLLLLASCGDQIAETPKPKGFPRLYLPTHQYQGWDDGCAYSLEIPKYATMERDELYTLNPCWFNLNFKPFNATLHITYHQVQNLVQLDSLHADSRKFAFKHTIKAEDILEIPLANDDRSAVGFMYHITGNTATNYSFYLTDSSRHFFRGALYFNTKTNPDSVAPVLQFLSEDLNHMIQRFRWKK
jgi:gliding motility-associated lipoprotein GldD